MYGLNDRLFQSTDDGKSWIVFNNATGETAFAIDSAGVMYVGTATALFRSADTGASWVDLHFRGARTLEVHAGILYAACDSGLYHSTDNGLNWSHDYLTLVPINKIAFSEAGDLYLVQDGVLLRAHNGSTTFEQLFHYGYPISAIAIGHGGRMFLTIAKDVGGDIEGSTDSGSTWFEFGYGHTVLNGIVLGDSGKIYAGGGVQDAVAPSIFTAGYAVEVPPSFASTTDISQGLAATPIRVLAITPRGKLLASTDSGIYRSLSKVEAVKEFAFSIGSTSLYPNPTNGAFSLRFTASAASETHVVIYDLLGREVARQSFGMLSVGEHTLTMSQLSLGAGRYLCVIASSAGNMAIPFVKN